MCGICGKLNFDRHEPVDAALLFQMRDILQHRGPDEYGEYRSGPVALGHRRLSIIDLNAGQQPMCNEDGTVWVVYNGEVYNYPELRVELLERGHILKSSTDTEVIAHLYEEIGVACVARLRGMFAFALWDKRKQILLLARDRVGIKPLYYANTGKAFLFASEIKSLLLDPSVFRKINLKGVDRFLTYYYMPGSETLLEGINKLEAGHYMTVCDGQIRKHQYWDLRFGNTYRWSRFDDAVEALQELLRRTVKDHMISDVPIGVLLSGGVDSTGVLRYAAEETNQPIRTFTVGFAGEGFADERSYARLAAQRFGTVHQDITMSARDFEDFLPKYVWHMEEPVCEPPAIALYLISRLARESSVKVLLSGEGGDEAFGGYQTYRNILILEALKSAFGSAKGVLGVGLSLLGQSGWENIRRYDEAVNLPMSQYYFSRTATPGTFFNRKKNSLYTKDFSAEVSKEVIGSPTRRLFDQINGLSPLNQMLYVDTKTWLPDDLLVKADKMTMATSVELRVPLLDFQVLEFAASLPPHYKVRGWSTKRILKAALGKTVPPEIINRKKTGFPLPYERWLRTELKDLVHDTILGQDSALRAYCNAGALREIVTLNNRGENLSKEVFCLLVLELWHRQFIGGAFRQSGANLSN